MVWLPEPGWVEAMGGLPDGMTADVWVGGEHLPDSVGEVEIVVIPSPRPPKPPSRGPGPSSGISWPVTRRASRCTTWSASGATDRAAGR